MLSLKHLRELGRLPLSSDHRLVLNRASYDNYKVVLNLTDNQMDAMFIVDDYLDSSQPIPSY
ncbi:hypothetical protein LCGC14_0591350 [marine sediment metagenome]|uniref:Uncharacterized protein n=1 Tax=marine sediment metagenome TaxID=412755 RepID=A0A0F9ULV4_9ZZZZ